MSIDDSDVERESQSWGPFDLGRSGAVEYDVDWGVAAPQSFQRGVVRIEADLVSGDEKVGPQLIGKYAFEKEPMDQRAARLFSQAQSIVSGFGGVVLGVLGTYLAIRSKLSG